MKKFFYLSLAAAAMLAAGCSKEMPNVDTVDNFLSADGTGFVKINIAFPSSASTKANDDFEDGLENEYAVENATLVLFSGPADAAENDLVLRSAYNLGQGAWDKNTVSNQITVERSVVAEIEKTGMVAGDQVWALVILNHHEFCEVAASESASNLTTLWGRVGGEMKELTGWKFGDIRNITLDERNRRFDTHSFFMSNMPYTSKPGGAADPVGSEVRTLYKLDSNKIVLDRTAAATGDPAAEVNVERALAKVDVRWGAISQTSDENHYPVEVLGWFIDNTNPSTFCLRHIEEPGTDGLAYLGYKSQFYPTDHTKPYRFVASESVCTHQVAYRPYWAVDPNYNVPANGLTNKGGKYVDNRIMYYEGDEWKYGNLRANGTAYYCTENTFDIAHQTVSNTTRVIVAAKFNNGHDFYTINVENGKMFTPEATAKYAIAAIMNRVSTKIWIQDNFKPEAYTGSNDGSQLFKCTITVDSATEGAGVCTVVVSPADDSVLNAWKKVSTKDVADIRRDFAQKNNDQYLASNFVFNFFKGGISYYQALIRHFNDEETPWTPTGDMTNTAYGVYGGDSASYLGRYGVVRNNWYSITLGGIRQIGSPVVPPVDPSKDPDTPDDQVIDYLKVKINIMPWSMRTQNIVL